MDDALSRSLSLLPIGVASTTFLPRWRMISYDLTSVTLCNRFSSAVPPQKRYPLANTTILAFCCINFHRCLNEHAIQSRQQHNFLLDAAARYPSSGLQSEVFGFSPTLLYLESALAPLALHFPPWQYHYAYLPYQ